MSHNPQPHTNHRIQTPIRKRKQLKTRLRINPRPNLDLNHYKHFRHIDLSLIKSDIVPVFPNFTHDSNTNWGGRFEDRLNLEVKNGREVMFWLDNWIDSEDLKSRFPRLFSVCK